MGSEDSTTGQLTFSKYQSGIFKKADALARLCNASVAVLINSPDGRPYTYGCPSFNEVADRFQNPNPRRERSPPSLKDIRIRKNQEKLDTLMEEIKQEKEYEKVLKKRVEETLEKYNMKEVMSLEELAAFKEKLEAQRDIIKCELMERGASSSVSNLSKNRKKKNKKKT